MAYLDAQGLAVVEMHAYWRFNAVFLQRSPGSYILRLENMRVFTSKSCVIAVAFLGNLFSYSKNVGEHSKRKTG